MDGGRKGDGEGEEREVGVCYLVEVRRGVQLKVCVWMKKQKKKVEEWRPFYTSMTNHHIAREESNTRTPLREPGARQCQLHAVGVSGLLSGQRVPWRRLEPLKLHASVPRTLHAEHSLQKARA